jgi:hypothetical protein
LANHVWSRGNKIYSSKLSAFIQEINDSISNWRAFQRFYSFKNGESIVEVSICITYSHKITKHRMLVGGQMNETITKLKNHLQFHNIEEFILTHVWHNLWEKHMSTSKIKQLAFYFHLTGRIRGMQKLVPMAWGDLCQTPGCNSFPIFFPAINVYKSSRFETVE